MSEVELGYLEECESWQVESYQFPSKVGGKPAWLSLENLPSSEKLQCSQCKDPLVFLCQVYAPIDNDTNNFHRTFFIFVCRKSECYGKNNNGSIKVFRSSLPQNNKFYSNLPPKEEPDDQFQLSKWLKLCVVCGCPAEHKCSRCKIAAYCSRNHQVVDWKESHKKICMENEKIAPSSSKLLFLERELVIEREEIQENNTNELEELKKFEELMKQNQTGTMNDVDEQELESHSAKECDKTFTKFRKCVAHNPEQVLRYSRNGNVLWIADSPIPSEIPNCEKCGGERQFEFQVMPQMLFILKENDLDWGVLVVYSCKNSCTDHNSYVEEFVFQQDVSMKDVI